MSSDEASAQEKEGDPTSGSIELLPGGRTIRGVLGATILDVLRENGVPIEGSCGGQGICGECRIRFVEDPPEPTSSDVAQLGASEIDSGWRLACRHVLDGDARIEVPRASGALDQKARDDKETTECALHPDVRARSICLARPSRDDPRPISERFRAALDGTACVPLAALRRLGELRDGDGQLTAIEADGEVLDARAGHTANIYGLAGLAIDVGTTTLAVHLLDLATGRQLGAAASRNPQCRLGADVIARIAHVRHHGNDGLEELHSAAIGGLNALIEQVAGEASVPRTSICRATVVGNPTMVHLFLCVDPRGIDRSPYVPVFRDGVRCRAQEVGLGIHPRAVVETLAAVSAYVGADIVAGLLAVGTGGEGETTLFLDIGTNGEIVLTSGGRRIACSTAAGPAFEGASVVEGMPALDGAIETVRVLGGEVDCRTIGGAPAIGLCGTGLVSAIAELRSAGVIEASGRFADGGAWWGERLDGEGKRRRFRLTDGHAPVHLYQSDVREFQLAKAAVRAGIEIQLDHAGLAAQAIDRVLIGGAFSSRLSSEHLVSTGLLPEIDPSRVRLVGNVAGQGAKRALLDRRLVDEAEGVARSIEYLELSGDERFADLYVGQMALP